MTHLLKKTYTSHKILASSSVDHDFTGTETGVFLEYMSVLVQLSQFDNSSKERELLDRLLNLKLFKNPDLCELDIFQSNINSLYPNPFETGMFELELDLVINTPADIKALCECFTSLGYEPPDSGDINSIKTFAQNLLDRQQEERQDREAPQKYSIENLRDELYKISPLNTGFCDRDPETVDSVPAPLGLYRKIIPNQTSPELSPISQPGSPQNKNFLPHRDFQDGFWKTSDEFTFSLSL